MMKSNDHFFQSVCALAIPVALQSMLQSAFSMVDQIMIGQLGEIQVAGMGLAGKFASIYAVLISAIGAAAGIMISQYLGQENNRGVRQSFFANLLLSGGIAGIFTAVCILFPERIMGAYTRDAQTRQTAAEYLALISGTFVPMAGTALLSTLLRCRERPRLPLYASIAAALLYQHRRHDDLRQRRRHRDNRCADQEFRHAGRLSHPGRRIHEPVAALDDQRQSDQKQENCQRQTHFKHSKLFKCRREGYKKRPSARRGAKSLVPVGFRRRPTGKIPGDC